jgi:glycosyltransferase involved in cell wall biosynthesis
LKNAYKFRLDEEKLINSGMPKHKLLCILHLPPPIHGASVIGQIISQSELINNSFDCDYIDLTTANSLKDIGTFRFVKLFTAPKVYWKVVSRLLTKRYDLCYFTINSRGPSLYKDLFIVLILKCFRQKIVYHYHNKGISEYQSGFIRNMLYRFQFKAQRVILLSPNLYYDVKKYVSEDMVYYCANGIPDNPPDIKRPEKHYQIPRLLFLSNMFISKGVFLLLESCKILADRNIKFECHFVGKWTAEISSKEFDDKCKENKLTEFIFSHGEKQGHEKDLYFSESDIFVFPTFNECFGLVILEAMKWGLPVVSTEEGAIPEIVDDGITGFVTAKSNPKLIADKIEIILKNDTLKKTMGQNGRDRFVRLYTLDKFEHNFVDTLNKILVDFKKESTRN